MGGAHKVNLLMTLCESGTRISLRASHDGERSYSRYMGRVGDTDGGKGWESHMGVEKKWELWMDMKPTQQDGVDVEQGWQGKLLKLEGEKLPVFSMSLQRTLSVG